MENQSAEKMGFTKAEGAQTPVDNMSEKQAQAPCERDLTNTELSGFLLSSKDAAEYRAYKKQKKVAEIMSAIARSEGVVASGEDVQRVCERAGRLKQSAMKLAPSWLSQTIEFLPAAVKMDCIIGGNGETLTRVKAFEAKQVMKRGARELTLVLAPSMVSACRYTEIRREIKRLRKVTKKACLKVAADGKMPPTTLSRLARICSETEVDFFSVSHAAGCEKLRFDLGGRCRLEVSEVDTLADFQRLIKAGVDRIVTTKIWTMYTEWLKEAEAAAAQAVTELPLPRALPALVKEGGKGETVGLQKAAPTAVTALIVAEGKKDGGALSVSEKKTTELKCI